MGVTGNDVTNCSRPWDRVLQLIPIQFCTQTAEFRQCLEIPTFSWWGGWHAWSNWQCFRLKDTWNLWFEFIRECVQYTYFLNIQFFNGSNLAELRKSNAHMKELTNRMDDVDKRLKSVEEGDADDEGGGPVTKKKKQRRKSGPSKEIWVCRLS